MIKQLAKKGWGQHKATFAQKESRRNPSAPFTTSSLQQDAYVRLGLPAKRTMQLAQGLYEAGHITYMRTDSTSLAKEAQQSILAYVQSEYGADMTQPREYKTKAASAQEAHEAVRPTHVEVRSRDLKEDESLTAIHKKLYDLIWRRTVASQMAPAVYADVTYSVEVPMLAKIGVTMDGKHSILVGEGYLRVYAPDQKADPAALKAWDALLSKKQAQVEALSLTMKGDVTRQPALYNEPSLVKTLEKEGIGRPSTYATILDKLFAKGYVSKGTNPQSTAHAKTYALEPEKAVKITEETITLGGKESDRLVPTSLGERVVKYLEGVVANLLDPKFTSKMEEELDAISEGRAQKNAILNAFYTPFHKLVVGAQKESKAIAKENREKKKRCKKDGAASSDCESQPPLQPRNVLRELKGANLVQTRFGPALFDVGANEFISGLLPLLQWKKKTLEELTQKDVAFLKTLPISFDNSTRQVVMGRYGIYVKDLATNESMNLPKDQWDTVYDGTITRKDVMALQPRPATTSKTTRDQPQSHGRPQTQKNNK